MEFNECVGIEFKDLVGKMDGMNGKNGMDGMDGLDGMD